MLPMRLRMCFNVMTKIGIPATLLATVLLAASCRKPAPGAGSSAPATLAPVPELESNRMREAPDGLLASRAASPVHWQHWEPSVLENAAKARRLVFAFIGSAQYPGCVEALDAIDRDPTLVARLNREFVPVLVDADLCRETSLAAGMLCQEIKQPVSFPFILVLSPAGNEVTWRPVAFSPGTDLRSLFEGAADVISRMWMESPEYVDRNSQADHANRLTRLPAPDQAPANSGERDEFLRRATRQLVSLYDEDIGSLSGTGGLLPLGILQCLASAALDPATPPDIALRSREAVEAFGTAILLSPMIDPLDGGVYSSRRGGAWDHPMANRTCMTQARAARALVTLHAATAAPRALEVAIGAVRFAEAQYATPDGLFTRQRQPAATPDRDWLWTLDQVEQTLDPGEAALWKTLCKLQPLGNLASESDPKREYFRLNSLGFRSSLAAAANPLGLAPDDAARLLASGREKLLAARLARVPQPPPAKAAAAGPSFRMVSAYAALFTATGDSAWRDKALALARASRLAFSKGALLVEQGPTMPDTVCDARAFTYALAIQAALDLAEVTLDESWRVWAGDLATTTAENFVDADGRLVEVRPTATPLQLPLEDRVMLFDDSTAGLMRMNLARLLALDQPPPPTIAPWIRSLPAFTDYPVIFTDSLLATSFARSRAIIELPADPSPEWRDAACRLPLDRIARRIGKSTEARIVHPDGKSSPLANPADLSASRLNRAP